MVAADAMADSPSSADAAHVRITLDDGLQVRVSRSSLASCSEFFTQLPAEDHVGDLDAELDQLAEALAPGTRKVLPHVIECLGAEACQAKQLPPGPEPWAPLFARCGVLHVFAVAHLLGASALLNAARDWVAENDRRLEAALGDLDVGVDAGSLRIALDFGLDQRCTTRSFIHCAAAADAADAMRVLLEKRGGVLLDAETLVDLRDSSGRTPLHTCAINNSTDAASVLIQASANLDALCASELDAAELEDVDQRTASISDCPSTRSQSQLKRWTPLHFAAAHDSAEIVELLLEARANLTACIQGVPSSHTPLHEAAEANAAQVARILAPAAAAATVDLNDFVVASGPEDTMRPLPLRVENAPANNGSEDEEVRWSRFLDPLNAKCGRNGSTPLHAAAEHDSAGVVKALMNAKADPSLTDDQGDTPLHCAALYGAPGAMAALLASEAPLMVENSNGELPIHLIAEFGLGDDGDGDCPAALSDIGTRRHFAKSDRARDLLVRALREHGNLASALAHKAEGIGGGTPLHAVALKDHPGAVHAVRLLADCRADLETRDDGGRTPLMIALRRCGPCSKVAAELRRLGATECTSVADAESEGPGHPTSQAQVAPGHGCVDALAQALGGSVRPMQLPGGLNVMEFIPAKVEAQIKVDKEADMANSDLAPAKLESDSDVKVKNELESEKIVGAVQEKRAETLDEGVINASVAANAEAMGEADEDFQKI